MGYGLASLDVVVVSMVHSDYCYVCPEEAVVASELVDFDVGTEVIV